MEDGTLQPLLKWPGGKRALLQHMFPLLPKKYGRYYEPFVGGGALFFALLPSIAVLSDNNCDLINCYLQVRDHPADVIDCLSKFRNTRKDYYEIRSTEPKDSIVKAARLIYLTTLSFNGIYRLNLKGKFNVPYGYKKHLHPCDSSKILSISRVLSNADLKCEDFSISAAKAKKGDLIYFDPPYTVAHGNNGFLKYNDKIFSWNDQLRLANLANDLIKRGCMVIVSNAYHPSILNLYKKFKLHIAERVSVIAASSRFRRQISECIFCNER